MRNNMLIRDFIDCVNHKGIDWFYDIGTIASMSKHLERHVKLRIVQTDEHVFTIFNNDKEIGRFHRNQHGNLSRCLATNCVENTTLFWCELDAIGHIAHSWVYRL